VALVNDLQNSPERGLTRGEIYAEAPKMGISGSIWKLVHHFRGPFRVLQVAPVIDCKMRQRGLDAELTVAKSNVFIGV